MYVSVLGMRRRHRRGQIRGLNHNNVHMSPIRSEGEVERVTPNTLTCARMFVHARRPAAVCFGMPVGACLCHRAVIIRVCADLCTDLHRSCPVHCFPMRI